MKRILILILIVMLVFPSFVYADSDSGQSDEEYHGGILSSLRNIISGIVNLPSSIVNGIKRLFVPDTNVFKNQTEHISSYMRDKFGLSAVDLSGIMGADTEINDDNHKVDTYNGIDLNGNSFINTTWLKRAVLTFRPYIRGFLVFLLIIYNINQFTMFIGAGSLSSLGSHIISHSNNKRE